MSVHRLDNRRTPCSLGLMRVREALASLPLGDLLEVRTRDRFAPYEVPAWVERAGLTLEFTRQEGFWLFSTHVFGIRKVRAVSAPPARVA